MGDGQLFKPGLLVKPGFLGTAAPFYADVVLLLELGMAIALVSGAILARRQKYRAHAFCQGAVVLLNLIVVVTVMLPAFVAHVLPKVPAKLGKSYYLLASMHAALGIGAEALGLYVMLAAGIRILPRKMMFTDYKLWMRSALVLWLGTFIFGAATYVRWYLH